VATTHHTPKLGIPVEMVQFLLKLLFKQGFLAVYHDLHWFLQPNVIHFMLKSRSQIFFLRLSNPGFHPYTDIQKQLLSSPVGSGGLWWAQPPQTKLQSPQIEIWNTKN